MLFSLNISTIIYENRASLVPGNLKNIAVNNEGGLFASYTYCGNSKHFLFPASYLGAGGFYDKSDCPVTEKMCQSVLTLPIFPKTTDDDMAYIAWAIKQLVG